MTQVTIMKTDGITEVSLNAELFEEMKRWCSNQDLFSTSYNHGWKPFKNGKDILVDRKYTINFCFQQTSISEKNGDLKEFYKITRGGRPTTKYGDNSSPKNKKRLEEKTPTFEAMIYPAVTHRRN